MESEMRSELHRHTVNDKPRKLLDSRFFGEIIIPSGLPH